MPSSSTASTADLDRPLPALPVSEQPNHMPNGESGVEAKKRRYSLDLYKYTNDQWEEVRRIIAQRRSSTDGSETATDSSQSSPVDGQSSIVTASASGSNSRT